MPPGSKWPEMGSNKYTDVYTYEKRKLDKSEENRITNVTGELEKFSKLQEVPITQVYFNHYINSYLYAYEYSNCV